MKTPYYDILDAMKAWAIPMTLPMFKMIFGENALLNILYITLLIPLVIYFSSLNPSFQINSETLAIILPITFLVSFGLYKINNKSKEALKDPREHRLISIPLYLTILFTFFMTMFLIGAFVRPLYVYKKANYA